MEKSVAASRKLDKPEALVRIVPLHNGRYGRTSRCRLKARAARTRCIAEVRRRRVVVVVEAAPLRSPKISIPGHARLGCVVNCGTVALGLATVKAEVSVGPRIAKPSQRLIAPALCVGYENSTDQTRSAIQAIDAAGSTFRLYPQTRLVHQRQHRFAEELEVRCEVEERDLNPVAAGSLEPEQLVNHMLGAADDLDVATKRAVLVAMSLPCNCVAGSLM